MNLPNPTKFISRERNYVEIRYYLKYNLIIECFEGRLYLTASIYPAIEKLWRA